MFVRTVKLVVLLSFLQLQQSAALQSIQEISQLFRTTQIVPDLIPAFNPSVLLHISFAKEVIPGQIVAKNGTEFPFPMQSELPLKFL